MRGALRVPAGAGGYDFTYWRKKNAALGRHL